MRTLTCVLLLAVAPMVMLAQKTPTTPAPTTPLKPTLEPRVETLEKRMKAVEARLDRIMPEEKEEEVGDRLKQLEKSTWGHLPQEELPVPIRGNKQ